MHRYLVLIALSLATLASCSKEARKVDINDGTENPTERYLIIETTHRYSNVADSLLPNVAVTLYENEEELLLNRYYRSDTTDSRGKLTFGNIKAGDFIVVLTHNQFGRKEERVSMSTSVVYAYEYYYF
jgi:hypothetical protein